MIVNVILQARFSSTRLPGKVLKKIVNKPMLALQIERIQTAKFIDKIIVATSLGKEDDDIALLCESLGVYCFRGSLDDVLDRFYQTAKQFPCDHIVRLTGDCPLIDSEILDSVINLHLENNADYTSNIEPPMLPDGLDVEIFTLSSLNRAWKEAKKPSEREHVTPYIRNNPELFTQQNFSYHKNLSHLRWTVDEKEDFEFVSHIFQSLYNDKPTFDMEDILMLLKEKTKLTSINKKYTRNEGMKSSKKKDNKLGYS
ncbi:MAG: spore coat protein [Gammaproteobacteria bacterium]|nr:MAG: spore coat protein [Gammaproteobacteria bacterium]